MKNLIILLFGCFVLQATAQTTLTSLQWQEDLKFLQKTVHEDYSFLFKKTTVQEFDAVVAKLYSEIPKLEKHEIIIGLSRLISSFKYGHTRLGMHEIPNTFNRLPINLYHFSDGIYIQGAHKDYADVLGAKVMAIANVDIGDALKAIYPVVPAENDQFFKAYGLVYLTSPQVLHAQGVLQELTDNVELTLEKDGRTFKVTLKALPYGTRVPTAYGYVQQKGDWLDVRNQGDTPLYLKNLEKIYYYEYLPEQKVLYIRQSQIQDEEEENIPAFYTRVFDFVENNDVERLIIDVRLNGGGNNYKNKAIITRIIESKKINKVGSLYVIIGRRTFSACQNLVNELDSYTNAIFMGEPTAENVNFYGDTNRIELPNSKTPVYLSFAWWQDKPQWENADWSVPHIAIDMSFEDYKLNKDPVLEAILSFSGSSFILDPMEYFTNLFLSGEIEKLKKDAFKMVNDSKYRFFDFEGEFNVAGYNILGAGQYQEAIFVFQLITELFPNSANAWDSLAEGFLKAGNIEKAKELYNKALSMDVDGPTGRNAREMLLRIENGH